ncbi:hypothetical protein [Ruminococcus albus]|uniref:Uncharacterized protein n=1 Tax=Ruminococcus albus 8 TaxID=246199 RepID=E9SEF9_RUMAL|nr:hypothetical protein [Ruminococcus albus]EGC02336.1 hypothetical protein CUS_4356 [Ruminococcus albus 8]MCC3352240.1 hypothetical protein [Ruminococcus albus 8]
MSKFQYTHFGDEVPRKVEKEYNRMGRREHYLEEQDAAHDVMYLDHKDISRIPDYPADELSPADLLRETRLCYLPVALELMRMDYPFEYQLIRDYYLSEKAVSMMYLAKKYAVSPKKVEYRINKAKRLLREHIIVHGNKE